MAIRLFARIAGLAIVAAEATAVATLADESSTLVFGVVFVALQIVAIGWATDRRSTVVLRMVAPALLMLTVADLADDAVVQAADERGVGRPRPLVAGGALVGLVPGCSVW